MLDAATRDRVTKTGVVYFTPGMNRVTVHRDLEFIGADGATLAMDLYHPQDVRGAERRPAVIIAAGYPDPGFEGLFGCRFKDTAGTSSWAQLIASAGLIAIAYANREPVGDFAALLRHLAEQGDAYGIDRDRLCLLAVSGNVPLALSALMARDSVPIACAAFSYGYMLDWEGSTPVADAARTFKFANPCGGKSVRDLRPDVPIFIARAGQDQMPRLNESLDRFVSEGLSCNLPLTVVNYARGPHAFDLFDDTEPSRRIVEQILAFFRTHVLLRATDGGSKVVA